MSYVDTLNATQKSNIDTIIAEAKKRGITNPISIAGMLAIVSKESNFKPQDENLNYSASRLQEVFGMSSAKANQIANNPEAIGNAVYGSKYGNASNEGYKYRGRGFNGLTFKSNYEKYGKIINENLVSNPSKVNQVDVASKILLEYNKNRFADLKKIGKLQFYGNAQDINDFKDTKNSVLAFYHVTAGNGNSVEKIKNLAKNDKLGGMSKALSRVDDLLAYVKNSEGTSGGNKQGISILGIILGLAISSGAFFLISKKL
jgi:putative chitinase